MQFTKGRRGWFSFDFVGRVSFFLCGLRVFVWVLVLLVLLALLLFLVCCGCCGPRAAPLACSCVCVVLTSAFKMLSRFARSASLRRAVRGVSSTRCFSAITEKFTHADIAKHLEDEGLDPNETVILKPAGENAYNVVPATQAELVDHYAQLAIEHDMNEEDANEGFLEAVGLGPFHRKATLVAGAAITAISNEFYVMNEETIVALCLTAGFTTMHVLLREPILAAYEDFQKETLKAQTDVRSRMIGCDPCCSV